MLYLMPRREGWRANHKRVERLYREEGLSLRRRRRRKRLSHLRVARARPVVANQTWAVDFIHDSLISGRHFRAFAVLDQWSRESLVIEVDVSLTGERVTRVLERLEISPDLGERGNRCGARGGRRVGIRNLRGKDINWRRLIKNGGLTVAK
jgi:putative transposase